MNKLNIFIIIVLSFINISNCFANDTKKSIVNLLIYKNDKCYSCSGVVIGESQNKTKILTAKHCIKSNKIIINSFYKVSSIITSNTVDLAYLETSKKVLNTYKMNISDFNTPKESDICIIGKYKNRSLIAFGKVTNNYLKKGVAFIRIQKGCSGGAVINKNNALVGIVSRGTIGILNNYSKEVIFVNITEIKNFLNSIKDNND